jgi:hypothetical protein
MPDTHSHAGSRLIFVPSELDYDFGPGHPIQPSWPVALLDLLESSGLWQRENEHTRLPIRAATIEELSLVQWTPSCHG